MLRIANFTLDCADNPLIYALVRHKLAQAIGGDVALFRLEHEFGRVWVFGRFDRAQCRACQHTNARTETNRGQYKPWISTEPFEDVSCDLIGPMPITEDGNRYALTIMDRFSKYAVVVPLSDIRADTVVQAILEKWVFVYGAPKRILSDNGTQFSSIIWKLVMMTIKTKIAFTTAYNPQANGMIERFHDFVKKRLSIIAFQNELDYWGRDSWDKYMACIVYAYNATVHMVTGQPQKQSENGGQSLHRSGVCRRQPEEGAHFQD